MANTMELTPQAVAEKVGEYLRECHPDGVTLEVDSAGIRQEDFAWRVPVRPDREPAKLFEYYDALANVEIALDDHEQLSVFLVPRDPINGASPP